MQPSSNTSVTFSLSHRSSNPAVTSAILFISTFLSLTSPSHISTKCWTFSTFPKPIWQQILSSLFSPIHLPVSTVNSAFPPLNFAIIHLTYFLAICTHLALHQPSIRFSTIPNFDLPSASIIHVSSPHTMHSPSSFTPHHPMKHLLASPPPHLTTQTSPNYPCNLPPTLLSSPKTLLGFCTVSSTDAETITIAIVALV